MIRSLHMEDVQKIAAKYGFLLLRLTLGSTFLWFGLLKLFGVSPVQTIIYTAMPSFVSTFPLFFLGLALFEVVIGVGFFTRRFAPYAATLMIVHLIVATLSVLVTQGFSPSFPLLTLEGEFVVKNLVLIAAGVVILGKNK